MWHVVKSAALRFILLDLVRRRERCPSRGHYVLSGTQRYGYAHWPS